MNGDRLYLHRVGYVVARRGENFDWRFHWNVYRGSRSVQFYLGRLLVEFHTPSRHRHPDWRWTTWEAGTIKATWFDKPEASA